MNSRLHLIDLVSADLYRCTKKVTFKLFLKTYLFNAGFKYLFWLRCTNSIKRKKYVNFIFFPISWLLLRHFMYKYGIGIPYNVKIGIGFKINHFNGIIVNSDCRIGDNVTISHGVTLGKADRGDKQGCPTIGDEVFIGPGAKIFGKISIGNNVAIGANAVVINDVPNNAVVAGIPAKLISMNGAERYIKNKYIEH